MTKEEKYGYWLQLAQYDLDTAEAMYAGGRWFYVAFMCQQAIEKISKGLYNFYIDDNIPRVHNIRFILTKIETSLSVTIKPEIYDLIDTLSAHYLNNRYPDFSGSPTMNIDKDKATHIMEKTREAFTWLLTLKK
jgi:HEPN domain-containing protein